MSNMNKKLANEMAKQERLMADLHVCAAVKVTAFDPAAMTVDVQPLLQRPQDGGYQTQPPVLGIPVGYTLGGGFIVRPWYKPGDVGVVVYMDQDMDAALLSGDIAPPSTQRRHAPDDAVFIGGIVTGGKAISRLPNDALVLATESGSIYLALQQDGIHIKGDVTVDGEVTANSIPLSTHKHGGVESGGGQSGAPVG